MDLYQEIIVRHHKAPVGEGVPAGWTQRVEGRNARCGDELTLYLREEGGVLAEIGFEARACAVTRAAASLLVQAVGGADVAEARRLVGRIGRVVEEAEAELDREVDGELAALNVLRGHVGRRECGLLPFRTLGRALADQGRPR